MPILDNNINQKRGQYQKISFEQRTQVLWYKAQGLSLENISILTGIKKKTVQSIQYDERQSCYKEFIDEVIRTYLYGIINEPGLQQLNEKKQKSFVKNLIRKEFNYETSQFQHLLVHKKNSGRYRVLNTVVNEILERYRQHLIKLQLNQIFEPEFESFPIQDTQFYI